jgi:hypothetical protein
MQKAEARASAFLFARMIYDLGMPTLSFFHGIVIHMFFNDHGEPHFHVRYAGRKGKFEIEPLRKVNSNLPPHAERLVLEWAQLYQTELLLSWAQCRNGNTPSRIQGLQ